MKSLNNANINIKYGLIIALLFVVFMSAAGFYVYSVRKKAIKSDLEMRMNEQLSSINDVINKEIEKNRKEVNSSLAIAHHLFYNKGELEVIDTAKIKFNAVNQLTKKSTEVEVNKWLLGGEVIQNNYAVVDEIKGLRVGTATIFQKIPQGYLRVSTNVMKLDGNRAVGTYIPNSSEVIRTIERGQTFKGRAFVVNDWYLTAYEPIRIDGEIKGILYVGVKEQDYKDLKELFGSKQYYKTGFAFLTNSDGENIIHPTNENNKTKEIGFYNNVIKHSKESGLYVANTKDDIKRIYYKYNENLDAYIGIKVLENEMFEELNNYLSIIIIAIAVLTAIFIIIILIVFNVLGKSMSKLVGVLNDLAKGKRVKKLIVKGEDEIGKIKKSINDLIEGLRNTIDFSNEIREGNLDAEYKPLSDDDVLGNSLLEMRKSLKVAKEEEEKRKVEDERRSWATNGLAKFGDILRQDNDDMEGLSYNIVSNLVKYLDANQGGLFILYNDNEETEEMINGEDKVKDSDKYFNLEACFAYNRKKYEKKRIEWGEGLIGRVGLEKKHIYMTDIPETYINITSGLGDSTPKSLLIVPLIVNEEIFGALELASFKAFEEHEIEFVEKIAESIASTISSVQVNIRTTMLLKKSQQQQEEMKAQEEEMRQNMEELQATQEEAARNEAEMSGTMSAVNNATGMAELDMEGKFISVNDLFLEFSGLEISEIKGKNQAEFMSEEIRSSAKYKKVWDDLNRGKSHKGGHQYFFKGKEKWLYESLTPVKNKDDEYYKVLVLANDITTARKNEEELKQKAEQMSAQEEELRQNMEELKATQEESERRAMEMSGTINALGVSTLYMEFDINGKILKANDKLAKQFNFSVDKIKGLTYDTLFKSNDKKMDFNKLVEKVKENDLIKLESGYKVGKKEIWLSETYSPIFDNNENLVKLLFIGIDITENKKQSKELEQKAIEINAQKDELQLNLNEMKEIQDELSAKEEQLKLMHRKNKNEIDELKSEIEMLNVSLKRKDKKIKELQQNKK